MRGRACANLAVVLGAFVAGCAGGFGIAPPRRGMVLERFASVVIGHADDVELTLRNDTGHTVLIPPPGPPFLEFAARSDAGRAIPCQESPPLPSAVTPLTLADRAEVTVRVDLTAQCAVDSRAEFDAEIRYTVPPSVRTVPGATAVWVGSTTPVHLRVSPSRAAASVP